MWNGDRFQYYELYVVAAKKIKTRFPNVKVGGPALANFYDDNKIEWTRDFLSLCRERDVPLDFFSWHYYPDDAQSILALPQKARTILDEYGFTETELHLNEWHYMHETGFDRAYFETGEYRLGSFRSAAHLVSVLTGWQDTPLDMGCFYTLGYVPYGGTFGIWEHSGKVNKLFYAFKAFAEIAHYQRRVKSSSNMNDVRILAGMNDDGDGALLVSDFKTACDGISIEIKGIDVRSPEIFVLDEERNLEKISPVIKSGKLSLPTHKDESIVYLIKGLRKN